VGVEHAPGAGQCQPRGKKKWEHLLEGQHIRQSALPTCMCDGTGSTQGARDTTRTSAVASETSLPCRICLQLAALRVALALAHPSNSSASARRTRHARPVFFYAAFHWILTSPFSPADPFYFNLRPLTLLFRLLPAPLHLRSARAHCRAQHLLSNRPSLSLLVPGLV
jgi:hypothetical protein